MPEYLVSADAGNANYASTLVAESPFVKAAEAGQAFYVETFREALWKLVAARAANSRLSDRVRIAVQSPRVSTRDRESETRIRRMLHDAGLLSKQTWAAQEELDYETEAANLRNASDPSD